jgi:hypothetical protein
MQRAALKKCGCQKISTAAKIAVEMRTATANGAAWTLLPNVI